MDRRMLNRSIINAPAFQKLNTATKLLYTYLILEADDYGLVGNPQRVLGAYRMPRASLTTLVEQGYLFVFESGVAVILHWPKHSSIPPSRRRRSEHIKEAARLVYNKEGIYGILDEAAAILQQSASVSTEQCRAVQSSATQSSATQCSATQSSATQCSATQCSATQSNAVQHSPLCQEEGMETTLPLTPAAQPAMDAAAQPADSLPATATALLEREETEKREADGSQGGSLSVSLTPLPATATRANRESCSPPGIPTREEVMAYAKEHGLTHVDVDRFYHYFAAQGFRTKTGSPVRWQLRLADWDAKDGRRVDFHHSGTFDTDEFFAAATKRSLDDFFGEG